MKTHSHKPDSGLVSPQQAAKIAAAQVNLLVRRLADGKPLTAAQLKFLKDVQEPAPAPTAADDESEAASDAELARALGIRKQVVSYHRRRSGSPDGRNVADWRAYLSVFGKGGTVGKVGEPADDDAILPRPRHDLDLIDHGAVSAFYAVGKAMPDAVAKAMAEAGVKVSTAKRRAVTLAIWATIATAIDNEVLRLTGERFLAGIEADGELPDGIQQLTAEGAD